MQKKRREQPRLSVRIGGLRLKNPIIAASGCIGYVEEYAGIVPVQRLGAVVTKSITVEERAGNPPPRIAECASGMLNAIGLENPGLDSFLKEHLPRLARLKTARIVSIAGTSIVEYVELAAALSRKEGVDAIELNISCPNVEKGLLSFSKSPADAGSLVRRVRDAFDGPIIVKLSPNTDSLEGVAMACEEKGADGVSLVNTFLGLALDWRTRRPLLGNVTGGLSGPCIKPLALRMVWEVSRSVKIPVIGIGGIASADDALEFIVAGARAVQVGTAIFANPRAAVDIVHDMKRLLEKQEIEDINDLVGTFNTGEEEACGKSPMTNK